MHHEYIFNQEIILKCWKFKLSTSHLLILMNLFQEPLNHCLLLWQKLQALWETLNPLTPRHGTILLLKRESLGAGKGLTGPIYPSFFLNSYLPSLTLSFPDLNRLLCYFTLSKYARTFFLSRESLWEVKG